MASLRSPRSTKKPPKSPGSARKPRVVPATVTVAADDQSNTSSGSRPGLRPHVLAALLREIESEQLGGIDRLRGKNKDGRVLSNHLDKNNYEWDGVLIFDDKGSVTRRKITKYVNRWVGYSRGKYLELLNQYEVQAFKSQRKRKKGLQTLPTEDDVSLLSDDDSFEEEGKPPSVKQPVKPSRKAEVEKQAPNQYYVPTSTSATMDPKTKAKSTPASTRAPFSPTTGGMSLPLGHCESFVCCFSFACFTHTHIIVFSIVSLSQGGH